MYLCEYLKIGLNRVYLVITNQYMIPVSVLSRKIGTYIGNTKEKNRKIKENELEIGPFSLMKE